VTAGRVGKNQNEKVEIANSDISESRTGTDQQMGEHRPDANAGRRDRGRDGLLVRPQNVRDGSSDGLALVEQLRLARHRDVGRRHAPRQRASMVVLAQQQHRTRRRLCPRREPHLKPNPGLNTTVVPRIGPRAPASPPRADTLWRAPSR
jgi:hypothetical protein